MINLTFPDGAKRQVEQGVSARDVAASISKSLEKKAVAAVVNGTLVDLSDPITGDSSLRIVTRDDPEALELIRHDCAHVLAEAVQELFPGTQVTIGPVIENGFYYDFFRNEPFTTEDFAAIEKKMREIMAKKDEKPFEQNRVQAARRGRGLLQGPWVSTTRPRLIGMRSRPGEDVKFCDREGAFDRPVPWPPRAVSTGKIGNALQADEGGRRLLARRFHRNEMLTARVRHGLGQCKDDLQKLTSTHAGGGREARPPQAWAARLDLFHIDEHSPGVGVLAPQGLDGVAGQWSSLHAPQVYRDKLDYQEVKAPADPGPVACGRKLRPLGQV